MSEDHPAPSDLSLSEFDHDTSVRRSEEGWIGEVHGRWGIGSNPNGGYLVALAARAMQADSGQPDPWSVTAHFLSPPVPGPVTVRTEVVKPGRTYSTVRAALLQGGRERVSLVGAFGDLGARRGPTRVTAVPPDLPPPDRCVSLGELAGASTDSSGFAGRIELRVSPDAPWGGRGAEDGPFEINGWIRFAPGPVGPGGHQPGPAGPGGHQPGPEPSVLSLLTFADAYPPTVIGASDVGWVPTIELTTHVRGRPAPGWLLGRFRTRLLIDGLLEEDGELWDSDGRPVAQSRQLAMVLPPRA
ncbi:MAG TPA: thioesterase family protein [Acidimicrobiales bacterium]|nr:thioesterase family protein [Acidimicrobiales bacterium]